MSISKGVLCKVQLVDGVFIPSEASDVISRLIREKINSYKLHKLSMCKKNANSDSGNDDSRVTELIAKRKEFKAICTEAKLTGKKIKINGVLEIEIID
jgi:hypothetical protein